LTVKNKQLYFTYAQRDGQYQTVLSANYIKGKQFNSYRQTQQ